MTLVPWHLLKSTRPRHAALGVLLVSLPCCLAAEPTSSTFNYTVGNTGGVPGTDAPGSNTGGSGSTLPQSGVAVIDSNPNQVLHLFTFATERYGLSAQGNAVSAAVSWEAPPASELWVVSLQGSGLFTLRQAAADRCLTADTGLSVQPCTSGPAQLFRVLPVLYGDLGLLQAADGRCVALGPGELSTVLTACNTAAAWRFEVILNGRVHEGIGSGTVSVASNGMSLAGHASLRPCSEADGYVQQPNMLSWLKVTNTTAERLDVERLDSGGAATLASLEVGATRIFQLATGSGMRLSVKGTCRAIVDTAAVVRFEANGALEVQGAVLSPCSAASSLRSLHWRRSVIVRTVNAKTELVNAFWLSYTGTEGYYMIAEAGLINTMLAFQSAAWILKDPKGVCIATLSYPEDPPL